MGNIGEIRAGLDKINGHIAGQERSIQQANEQAEAGYQKLRAIHDHLMQAWIISRDLGKDFKEAGDTIYDRLSPYGWQT